MKKEAKTVSDLRDLFQEVGTYFFRISDSGNNDPETPIF
jgi:hypothetical protein